MTVLDEILEHKRREVSAAKEAVSPLAMERSAREWDEAPRSLRNALTSGEPPRVIAEIKRRSPSRGEIRADFDPVACAKAYAEAGAAAISVLTEARYFGGCLEHLDLVRAATDVPILRKDFVFDAYQIDETRARGADAVLLIVAAFPDATGAERLRALRDRAVDLGLEVLVEVHDAAELDSALAVEADLVGINNRNLKTFEVDLGTTERLAVRLPRGVVVVSESGIFTNADIRRLERAGAHAVLVGESLMREPDVGVALERLRRNP